MKILFLIQSNKINKAGLPSLWCRITYNKTRKQFSTGTYIKPEFWDKEKQKVLDEAENSKIVNSQISLIKQNLTHHLVRKAFATTVLLLNDANGSCK